MVTPANKRPRQVPTLETRGKPCVQRMFHLPFGAIALNSAQRRAWPPRLPTPTTTTASRRRQSQVTRIICLGRPRHHRQFGDPGQQTPTTSAHPGDTGTTLRPAHVPSSFGAIALTLTQRRAWPPRLTTPTTTTASRRRYHKGHTDHLPLASSTRTQKSVSPCSRCPRQVPTLVT